MEQVRHKSHKYIKRPKPPQNIQYQAMAQSLKAKGYLFVLSIDMNEWHLFMWFFSNFRYLRAQNPYQPPKNVPLLVDKLKESANLTTGFNGKSFTLQDKFDFLTLCGKEFNHTVPNSVLHEIQTISKLFEFFFLKI